MTSRAERRRHLPDCPIFAEGRDPSLAMVCRCPIIYYDLGQPAGEQSTAGHEQLRAAWAAWDAEHPDPAPATTPDAIAAFHRWANDRLNDQYHAPQRFRAGIDVDRAGATVVVCTCPPRVSGEAPALPDPACPLHGMAWQQKPEPERCPDCGEAVAVGEVMEPGATGQPVGRRVLFAIGENEPHVCAPFGGLTVEDVPAVAPYTTILVELELVDDRWRVVPAINDGDPLEDPGLFGGDIPGAPPPPTLRELHTLIGAELAEAEGTVTDGQETA